jgi:hypothetical protein
MVQAANDLAMAPLGPVVPPAPAVRPRAAGADTMAEIRQLDPADQQEAIGLLAASNNQNAAGHVRRYAQNRLDELLLPVRQIPTGEAIELPAELPVGEATELDPEVLSQRLGQPSFTQQRAISRGIPTGDATEMIPAGETSEVPDIPVGDLSYIEPDAGMAPRNRTGDGVEIDPAAPNAVAGYIKRMAGTNTPAARAFVQDYRAGRITDADVLSLILPRKSTDLTPDQRIAAAAAQAPKIQPGDLLTGDGMPYGTKSAASVRATREGGGNVIEVPGGYVVRKEIPSEPVTDLAGTAGRTAGAADGRGDQPGGSGRAVRPVPDGAGGVVQVPAAPVAGGAANAALEDGARQPDAPLTPGDRVNFDGKTWTVTDASPSMVRLDDGQGMRRAISPTSAKWKQVTPAEPSRPDEATGVSDGQSQEGRQGLQVSPPQGAGAAISTDALKQTAGPTNTTNAQSVTSTTRSQAPAPAAATEAPGRVPAAGPAGVEADGVSPLATAKVGDTVDVVHRDSNGALRVAGTVLSVEDAGVWIKESDGRRRINRSDFGNWISAGTQEKKTDNYATWTAYEGAAPAYVTVIDERDGEVEIDDGYTTQWVPKSQVEQAGKEAADAFESEKLNLTRIKEISDRQGMTLHTDHMRSPGLAATGWSAHAADSKPDELIRKATNSERLSPAAQQRAINSGGMAPAPDGFTIKYRPKGDKGAGFYYVATATPNATAPVEAASTSGAAAPGPVAPDEGRQPFEHAGLKVYPTKIRSGGQVVDRWAVQLPENKGTDKVLGDTLHETVEAAKKSAEYEARRAEDIAKRNQVAADEEAQRAAKVEANRGKTLRERAIESTLDKQVRNAETGAVTTRREWVQARVAEGLEPKIEAEDKIKPLSRSAFNRATNEEQRAHDARVKAAGKVDAYYLGNFAVTKTEHDYALSLKNAPADPKPAEPPVAAPAAEPAPAPEQPAAKPEPKPKRPPKSFRKTHMVETAVFVEESGKFETREVDADTALKALDEDIAEMTAFRKCITGG